MNKDFNDEHLIYKSGKTITDEQANSILWKTFKYHTLGPNFLGWVANSFGNALLTLRNKNGFEFVWCESNRPLTPIDYDDDFFYCTYDQGADDYKTQPNESLQKRIYFTPKIDGGIPEKNSYMYGDKIIVVDKWFFYNAINKECETYKNTPFMSTIEQILVLDKICYTLINLKQFFEAQMVGIYKKIWNQKTMSYEIVDNLIKDLRKIDINNPNDRYIHISYPKVFSELKSKIPPPSNSIVNNLNNYSIKIQQRKNIAETQEFLNYFIKKCFNNLYNKIDIATKNLNKEEKEKWLDNINNFTENLIDKYNKQLKKYESGKYPKNWDAIMLSNKISETKSSISKLEKNLLDNERINKLKKLFFTTYEKRNKNINTKEEKNNKFPKKKNNEKER